MEIEMLSMYPSGLRKIKKQVIPIRLYRNATIIVFCCLLNNQTPHKPSIMKIKTLFCLFYFVAFQLSAQEVQKFKFDYTIQSEAFGDEREISVYLPPSFYEYPEDRFTVTYILDGHFDPFIDLAAKTIEYNTYMYKYTPTIVVGVHAKQRGWEFSAPQEGDEDDQNYKGGRAPELQQHFKNEIFPLVDSIYGAKTLPFRNIVGHSSGGVFVLYTLFSEESDLFDGYIGISPGIRSDSEYIFDQAVIRLKTGKKLPKFLYCSSGTVGEREELFGGAVAKLDSIFKIYPEHGLIWKQSKFEGMGHWTCVPPSINTGMVELTRAFRVDEKMFFDYANNEGLSMTQQLESFYENRKKEYGFVEIPPGGYLSRIAWELQDKGKVEQALEVYDWGMKQHPEHYTLVRSKARLLQKVGKNKAAYSAYAKALENLEIVKGKMSEEDYVEKKNKLNKIMGELKEGK